MDLKAFLNLSRPRTHAGCCVSGLQVPWLPHAGAAVSVADCVLIGELETILSAMFRQRPDMMCVVSLVLQHLHLENLEW